MSSSTESLPPRIDVICLCAAWCGVCRDYQAAFTALGQQHSTVQCHWMDVEDEADLLDELDVENFPTLLIGVNGQPVFYGTLLPHIQTLERLVQDAPDLAPLVASPHTATLLSVLRHVAG